ncbi:MAG: dTDP-glucose 4,6-dehydratase [Bacteroidetes bacterium]|nr:MAG: dTDP-glucose 4,6-dehydratase [Bacteroidota bacterium]
MKTLIIGSKGFIGTHCFNHFIKQGHKVYGCDVVVDYTAKNYFLVDATNANYQDVFEKEKFDVCINCSGAANVQDSIANPQRDFQLNTVNVFSLLNAIKTHNPECKFINLSSAAVYGHPERLPVQENQALQPISPYGFHKKYAEEICLQFNSQFNIKTCSLRIFSAYGPGLKKQLFWDLYKKIEKTDTIELFGTGEESRDFIYIDDLVIAIEKVIKSAQFKGEYINVASGKELMIKDVSTIFIEIVNKTKSIRFNKKQKPGDPKNWVADISVLSSFGFLPNYNLNQGLTNYIKWIKNEKL